MIAVVTDNTVKDRDAYLPLARAFAADAAHDAGCRGMTVCIDPMRPDHVVFLSRWEDEASWHAHVGGATFQKHIPAMGAYYAGGVDTILTEV